MKKMEYAEISKNPVFEAEINSDLMNWLSNLKDNGFEVFVLDEYSMIENKLDLMNAFYHQAKFPDYFGANWDAVDECLNDYQHLPSKGYIFIFKNPLKLAEQSKKDYDLLISSFIDASKKWAKQNVVFNLILGITN